MTGQEQKLQAISVNRWIGTTLQMLCVMGIFDAFHPFLAFPDCIMLLAVTIGMIALLFGAALLGVSEGKPLYRRIWGIIAFANAHLSAFLIDEAIFRQSAQAGAALSYALVSTVVSTVMCVMEACASL